MSEQVTLSDEELLTLLHSRISEYENGNVNASDVIRLLNILTSRFKRYEKVVEGK